MSRHTPEQVGLDTLAAAEWELNRARVIRDALIKQAVRERLWTRQEIATATGLVKSRIDQIVRGG